VNRVALLWFVQTSLEESIVVTEGLRTCINTVVGEHCELGKNGSKREEKIPLFLLRMIQIRGRHTRLRIDTHSC
jgi:hypothetical protein